jgi:DNA-binding transcriptional ArsR family regulator
LSEEEPVERVLGSVGRLRILRVMAEDPRLENSFSLYRLKALTGIGDSSLKGHLATLKRHGLVEEVGLDHLRRYRLVRGDPLVEAIIQVFRTFEARRKRAPKPI